MQQKYELETRLTYFWHKNEKKISKKFIFVFEPLSFRHTYPSFLLSKLASQIKFNTICGGGQLLVTGSQGPITGVPGARVPCTRVTSPKAKGPSSRVPGSQVSGSQVSGPDVRLCHKKAIYRSSTVLCKNMLSDMFWVFQKKKKSFIKKSVEQLKR